MDAWEGQPNNQAAINKPRSKSSWGFRCCNLFFTSCPVATPDESSIQKNGALINGYLLSSCYLPVNVPFATI